MFVELLDKLRCLNTHEDSPLVATSSLTKGRRIIEGTLGCPVCHAEYAIHGGAVDYGRAVPVPALAPDAIDDEKTIRLAALLGLDERGGVYVLDTISSRYTAGLVAFAPNAQFIAISGHDEIEGAGMVIKGSGAVLPLAEASVRGIALDFGGDAFLRSAVHALASGGRLVVPADTPVPGGISVLARDDEQWVGERESTPQRSALKRALR